MDPAESVDGAGDPEVVLHFGIVVMASRVYSVDLHNFKVSCLCLNDVNIAVHGLQEQLLGSFESDASFEDSFSLWDAVTSIVRDRVIITMVVRCPPLV